jgi:predicted Zn-dependent protease with MMP-like domain
LNSEEFEAVVEDVVLGLPDWVREAFDNLRIQVTDSPDPEMDPDRQGLLGLYIGIPLTERSANEAGSVPDVIYIFRLPHLALGLPPDELRREIAVTVMHEIAHYFGIDDDHLEEIGWD